MCSFFTYFMNHVSNFPDTAFKKRYQYVCYPENPCVIGSFPRKNKINQNLLHKQKRSVSPFNTKICFRVPSEQSILHLKLETTELEKSRWLTWLKDDWLTWLKRKFRDFKIHQFTKKSKKRNLLSHNMSHFSVWKSNAENVKTIEKENI